MDQVKQVLAVLKKHHFWVLSGLLLLIGLGVWQTAVGKLASQYQEREGKLNSLLKEVQGIKGQSTPPNQLVVEAIKQSHERLKEGVFEAWKTLYQVQKDSNPWPSVLSPEFVEAAEALKPGENYLKPGEEFKYPKYLEEYQNFIKNYLPQLGLIVDVLEPKWARDARNVTEFAKRRTLLAKRRAEKKKAADARAAEKAKADEKAKQAAEQPADEEEMVGKVIWDEASQNMIMQSYDWPERPTTLQVLIGQEDLWVYGALLRIIRDTNEGATSYYKAPVKQIFSLEIGRMAAASFASGTMASFGGGGGYEAMMSGSSAMPGMMPGMSMPGMSGPGMSGPGMSGPMPGG